ncbi:MAG: DUF1080 domain-containing protein [Bryobacterales bacterium]|nr:DUF1080 domain-containing protein [Bryobacterales bacterium]
MRMPRYLPPPALLALVFFLSFSASLAAQGTTPAHDAAFLEDSPAWKPLFDGHGLGAWRFLHDREIDPRFWRVENGLLRTLPGGPWGADIITRDTFDNFAFCAEWKVAPGGNSGILYNVREDQWRGQTTLPATVRNAELAMAGGILLGLVLLFLRRGFLKLDLVRGLILGLLAAGVAHFTGPFLKLLAYDHYMRNWKAAGLEMQISDDGHFEGSLQDPIHSNGALYDIFAPTSIEGRSAGEWNESCVVVDGQNVEHWMNGVRILRYRMDSPEFAQAVARSNYRSIAGITRKQPMHVAVQNHDGQETWFRKLRVRSF